jgi:hypothetical protein
MGLLSILCAVGIGCALAYRFGQLSGTGPRWAQVTLILGAGIGLGAGLTGIVFFLARTFVPIPMAAPILEAAIALWLAWEVYRMPRPSATPSRSNWTLGLGTVAVLAFAFTAFAGAWEQNPQGAWDAFSIWNLRARIIASPEGLASRAWSPLLSHTHPGYPMLLSSFVGRAWAYSGAFSAAVPIFTSALFFVGMLCMGVGALTIARWSSSLGLAFGLILAASPSVLHEVPAQYADIPLAYFFVATVAMALLDRPVIAGVFAGLATFTKNEGVVFLLVAAVAMLATRRRVQLFLAGAAPAAILTAVFKLGLAAGAETPHLGAANMGQLGTISAAFASEFLNLGAEWYHPLLPVAALALFWGFDKRFRPGAFMALGIALTMLVAYFAVVLFTTDDVSWQLGTALPRLYVQVWPTALFGCVFLLRSPDEKTA